MAARLGSLDDDEVATRALGCHCLGQRPDLPADQGPECASAPDQARIRFTVEELDDPRAASSDRDTLRIEKRDQEVDPEDALRSHRKLLQNPFEEARGHQGSSEHPETTR